MAGGCSCRRPPPPSSREPGACARSPRRGRCRGRSPWRAANRRTARPCRRRRPTVSTRTPGPPGSTRVLIAPGLGANVSGCSALMRHSMACPSRRTPSCSIRERPAGRDPDLRLDDVDPGHRLGDAVLHLDAGVDLHEVEPAVPVDQELERPGVHVADGPRRRRDEPADARADVGRESGRRGPLRSPSAAAAAPSTRARRGGRCAPARRPAPGTRRAGRRRGVPSPDRRGGRRTPPPPRSRAARNASGSRSGCSTSRIPPAAPAPDRLDEEGIADVAGRPRAAAAASGTASVPGTRGRPRRPHHPRGRGPCRRAAAGPRRGGPMKATPALRARLGEVGALRQEAVARMHGLGAGDLRRGEDGGAGSDSCAGWAPARCTPSRRRTARAGRAGRPSNARPPCGRRARGTRR